MKSIYSQNVPLNLQTSSSTNEPTFDRGSGRLLAWAIALLLAPIGLLGTAQKAQAFWPACSFPNLEDVGGDGNGPATVDQSLRLAEILLTHPSATFCSMITEYEVTTFIQWLDQTKGARDEFPGDRCPGSGCPDNAQPQ